MSKKKQDESSKEFDRVVKRMLDLPPKPHQKEEKKPQKGGKK